MCVSNYTNYGNEREERHRKLANFRFLWGSTHERSLKQLIENSQQTRQTAVVKAVLRVSDNIEAAANLVHLVTPESFRSLVLVTHIAKQNKCCFVP